jgi:hypothetical protein
MKAKNFNRIPADIYQQLIGEARRLNFSRVSLATNIPTTDNVNLTVAVMDDSDLMVLYNDESGRCQYINNARSLMRVLTHPNTRPQVTANARRLLAIEAPTILAHLDSKVTHAHRSVA